MAVQRTFSIIKPDATKRNLTGAINAVFEKAGLRIVAQKRVRLTRAQAEGFYGEHKARGFFGELVDFMTSGPVVIQVLEGENAVARHREVMGATDPAKAADGTVHESKGSNVIKGFPEGTPLAAWGVNGHWVAAKAEHAIAQGSDMVIPFAVARELRDVLRAINPKGAA